MKMKSGNKSGTIYSNILRKEKPDFKEFVKFLLQNHMKISSINVKKADIINSKIIFKIRKRYVKYKY